MAIAGDRLDEALALSERLVGFARETGAPLRMVDAGVTLALARDAAGNGRGAVDAVLSALEAAEPEGMIRAFADAGAGVRGPLEGALRAYRRGEAGDVSEPYVARLLAALPGGSVPSLLTRSELEVMRSIASGASNQEIADRLFIALSTVKKHVNHIYAKLGARTRTGAVARARELGIVE